MSARSDASEPTGHYSTWSALSIGLLAVAVAGALMLIASDFTTLVQIKVITVVKESVAGHEQHSYAMTLVGIAALPLAYGAAHGRSRPAMVGLIVLGAVVLFIAVVKDLPDTRSEGVIGLQYESAHASPGAGFYLETGGAVLLLLAGVGGLVLMPAKRPTSSASAAG